MVPPCPRPDRLPQVWGSLRQDCCLPGSGHLIARSSPHKPTGCTGVSFLSLQSHLIYSCLLSFLGVLPHFGFSVTIHGPGAFLHSQWALHTQLIFLCLPH